MSHLVQGGHEHDATDHQVHCPDLHQPQGLMDTIHLCVLLMFGAAIYPAAYQGDGGDYDIAMRDNIMAGRGIAQTVIDWLNLNAFAYVGDEKVGIKCGIFYPLFVHIYHRISSLLCSDASLPFTSITYDAFVEKVATLTAADPHFQTANAAYCKEWADPLGDPPAFFDFPKTPIKLHLSSRISDWHRLSKSPGYYTISL